MDPTVLTRERIHARLEHAAADDLLLAVCAVPTPHVADRLQSFDRVVAALLEAIPRLTAVAPPPHLAHRGRLGFVSPFGLQRTHDGFEGVGFRYWHDGGFAVAVGRAERSEGEWPALVGEACFYALLHIGAVCWSLSEPAPDLRVRAVTGRGPDGSAGAAPASVEGSIAANDVEAIAWLSQVIADRAAFGGDGVQLPFSDAATCAALAAALTA